MKVAKFYFLAFTLLFLIHCKKGETKTDKGFFVSMNIDNTSYSIPEEENSMPFLYMYDELIPQNTTFKKGLTTTVSVSNKHFFESFHVDLSDTIMGKYVSTGDTTNPSRVLYTNFQIITDTAAVTGYALFLPDLFYFPDSQISFLVNITAISDEVIEGNFSGTLAKSTGTYATVSNGLFRMHHGHR